VSFEFYPPRDVSGQVGLLERARRLEELAPDFVSVTYGAGGGSRSQAAQDASVNAALALGDVTLAARIAHLTLSGHSRAELCQVIERFLEGGAAGFMALRGDPPGGASAPWIPTADGLTYAVELVELIRSVSDLPVGVAAFPLGHPAAVSLEHDAAVLASKQAAGASFALTQVVFEAAPYFRLRDRAAAAGATLPIVPGIMPVTARSRIEKLIQLSGAPLPSALSQRVTATSDPSELDQVGVEWSVKLTQELLQGGAPGVHFYTLNSSPSTQAVCSELGLRGRV
jgi:methylenetetrahydrofolate reductase (NADPH)